MEIKRVVDIHRIPLNYDFDMETFTGKGLILEKNEDEGLFM